MKEQHTDEVFLVIDRLLSNFDSTNARNRDYKINVLHELSNYQTQLNNHIVQSEEIDLEFANAYNHIIDWFYNNYTSMIIHVAEVTDGNTGEISQYLTNLSTEVHAISDMFNFVNDDQDMDRETKAALFAELYSKRVVYVYDDFIQLRLDTNEELIVELNKVIGGAEREDIIDAENLAVLSDIIGSFVGTYEETAEALVLEINDILLMIDTELSLQELWFEEHYTQLIDEIVSTEKEDDYDDATVRSKIELLENVDQLFDEDRIVSIDFIIEKSELIEQLLDELESELDEIVEHIRLRDEAAAHAAAAAAAAARRRNQTTSSSSNNRPGTTSGSSSAAGNQSGAGSATVSGGGRYPAITTNCREMLARLVKLEAPNEPADGKQAVAEVVLNRMISSRWDHANTVEGVIFDTRWGTQFTVKDLIWTDRGAPTSADYAAVDRALSGPNVLAKEYMFFRSTAVTQNDVIWIGAHAFSK